MRFYELVENINRKELEDSLQPFLTFISSGKPIPRKDIARELQASLEALDVAEVNVTVSDHVDSGDMNLNAYYDPDEDEEEFEPFFIDLVFSPKDKTIRFDPEGVENIKDRIIDALEHEMIHMNQYRGRGFVKQRGYRTKTKDPKKAQVKQYLGNDDEIQAFAKNIASELVRKADKDGAVELLRMANKTAQFKDEMGYLLSPNLFGYLAAWDFDATHPVIKKLLKKVYNYIQTS